MTLYPQSILDEIRDRISIVSYINEHVPLKKAGRNFRGLCPFHGEKTPSFMVNDEKQIYHCFGCNEGGNIFKFVMKYEGLTFPEAVEQLAGRSGVILPKKEVTREEIGEIEQLAKKKKLLFRVNEIAAHFFRNTALDTQKGTPARNYLKSRRIFDDIFTQHFLGYAEDRWDALLMHLKEKKVPLQLAQELGLTKKRSGSDENYDFFRGRLIFPIINEKMKILGFGGRIIREDGEEKNAKYVNSSDSAIYHKSYSVYGLNTAAREIRQADQLIIVEGYMDVLGLAQAGIKNVVAPLGTALTTAQIRLLGRYSRNMVLIFDGDDAGVHAAERSLANFIEVGLMPKLVVLAGAKDPDEWIQKHSATELTELVKGADTLLAWYMRQKAVLCGRDAQMKFGLIAEMKDVLGRIGTAQEFTYYRSFLADQLKMDENDLIRQLSYKKDRTRSVEVGGGMVGSLNAERMLIALMLEYPAFIRDVKSEIDSSYFLDESFKTLFELILNEDEEGKFSVGRLMDKLYDENLKETLHSLSLGDDVDDEKATCMLKDCLRQMSRLKLTERLKSITDEIVSAEKINDMTKVNELLKEKSKLILQNI